MRGVSSFSSILFSLIFMYVLVGSASSYIPSTYLPTDRFSSRTEVPRHDLKIRYPTNADTITSLRAGGDEPTKKPSLKKQMIAEFLGTMLIVQLGCGAVMSDIFGGAFSGLFQVAAAWIMAVTIAIATTGPVSGAHLNPGMSIAFALVRKEMGWMKTLAYIVAQIGGAAAGAFMNLLMYGKTIQDHEATNGIVRGAISGVASAKSFGEYFASPVTTATAFLAEAFGTAVLAFVVFSLTNPKSKNDGVYIPPLIGITVGALICTIAPLTMAGFNPARSLGPRIVSWFAGWKVVAFQKWWVYTLAPIIGASTGAIIADKVLYADD
eukprot:CAMPEP_0202456698 /NCGR_PEP_ID=MMETSP1360-20130828/13893_1 /ASSEMBLY_ACC=CAM_ASM_000848 /TAXON_ID=515479 /ORGANISM="Licmophora paradoxa, Strain CCMP2313" /LENGTH=322 /DNA_ID=CAMNT_0049076583 /DNA_START=45 /DNA_END=1013 /DNA_ORIENTATION=+